MKLGLITYEMSRTTLDDLFKDIAGYGFTQAQFAFHPWCKGYENNMWGYSPDNITLDLAKEVKRAADNNGVEISIVNGYVNLIARDASERRDALYRLELLASVCPALGCNKINICTGSRSPEAMWIEHPENDTVQAWHDIREALEQALTIAEHYRVYLGIECEASNVISTAEKARRIMDEMGSPLLKIVLDGANLFQKGMAYSKNSKDVLKKAFDCLGGDIMMVHGKDVKEGPGLDFTYAGNGIVDFDYMLEQLKKRGYKEGVILHGAHSEAEVASGVAFMKQKLKEHGM